MKPPLVSIITPTFNHAGFIERCIRSARQQTYRRWEMVVVDDASTDGTLDRVRTLAAQDPRIRVIAHARRRGAEGLAETYNEALAAARGELIAVLEGDDWWAPDRLARQVPLFEDSSVVLAYADCWEVSETGRPIGHVATPVSPHLRSSPADGIGHFSTLGSVPACTVLIRRHALERAGGFRSEGLPVVDYPTWLALTLQGGFVRVPAPLAFWRRHAGSVYRRNLERVTRGCHQAFGRFVEAHGQDIVGAGIRPEDVLRAADEALTHKLESIPYFDAKYELLCGDRSLALRKFLRLLGDPAASRRHRLAAVLGAGAALSSPRVFSVALSTRRAAMGMGGAPAPLGPKGRP